MQRLWVFDWHYASRLDLIALVIQVVMACPLLLVLGVIGCCSGSAAGGAVMPCFSVCWLLAQAFSDLIGRLGAGEPDASSAAWRG